MSCSRCDLFGLSLHSLVGGRGLANYFVDCTYEHGVDLPMDTRGDNSKCFGFFSYKKTFIIGIFIDCLENCVCIRL